MSAANMVTFGLCSIQFAVTAATHGMRGSELGVVLCALLALLSAALCGAAFVEWRAGK